MNDTTARIKLLTKWYITLFILSLFSIDFSGQASHPLLLEYMAEQENGPGPVFFIWFGIPFLVAHFTSLFGILTSKLWARPLFLGTIAIGFLIGLYIAPEFRGNVTTMTEDIALLITGMICALLLWTPSVFNGQKPVQPYPL